MENYHIIIVFNKVDLVNNFNINYNIDNTIKLYFSSNNYHNPLQNYSTVMTSCKNNIGFDDLRSIIIENLDKMKSNIINNTNLITLTPQTKEKSRCYCL
jgi:50S ribosomal subunit-associated GTPase HflX